VDVLDLSVRCQPPLDNVNNWTTSTTLLTEVENTSPPWSNSVVSRTAHYQLEPISPSSSPSPQPSSYGQRDVFYRARHVDDTSQPSPVAAGRWSSDAPVVTTSTAQLASRPPRRWNGDAGHPYSPLKRVLHQYRNSVALQENTANYSESNNDSGGGSSSSSSTSGGNDLASSLSTPSTMTNAYRKPTSTTAGMSFEQFVLGMLSKVGGGKAITAATQSYLRETSTAPSSRVNGTTTDSVQPQSDSARKLPYYDQCSRQTSEQRRQLERHSSTTSGDKFSPSLYHPRSVAAELAYPTPHAPSDIRLIAPPAQSCLLAAGTTRPSATRGEDRDEAYRERRRKNNEAAKRSRDTRRLKELQVAAQAERLAEENLQLKAEIAVLRSQLGYLHRMMLDNNNGSHVSVSDDAQQNDHSPRQDGGRTV